MLPQEIASKIIDMALILKKRDSFALIFAELLETEPTLTTIVTRHSLPWTTPYSYADRMPELI